MVVPSDVAPVFAQNTVASEAREAVAAYRRRNYGEAVKKFEGLLARRMDLETTKQVRAEVTDALAKEFAANTLADATLQSRLRGVGNWLLSGRTSDDGGMTLSDSGRIKNDAAGVERFVREYFNEANLVVRSERGKVIASKYGEYAVGFIADNYLASQSVQERGLARTLLTTIGNEAVLPLNQLLWSSNALTREYACHALGDIGDSRAVPGLAQLAAMDASTTVKAAAKSAIDRIGATVDGGPVDPNMFGYYWWIQAHGYYTNAAKGGYGPGTMSMIGSDNPGNLPLLVDDASRTRTVWRLRDDKLVGEEIPLWNYADTLAEDAALRCVQSTLFEAGREWFPVATGLYARISLHQYQANRARLASTAEGAAASVVGLLGENGISRLSHLMGVAGASGPAIILNAINDSLEEGYPDVTAGLCDLFLELDTHLTLQPMIELAPAPTEGGEAAPAGDAPAAPTGDAPAGDAPAADAPAPAAEGEKPAEEVPVVEAVYDHYIALTMCLSSPSRQVRYAAARALAVVGRGHNLPSTDLATTQMAAALEETDIKTVALIAENPAVRTNYHNALMALGYSVRVYDKLDSGLHQVRNSATIDAILIQGDLARQVVSYWEPTAAGKAAGAGEARQESAVKVLRDDVRTRDIPLLLAVPEGEAADYSSTFGGLFSGENFSEQSLLPYGENVNIAAEALQERIEGFIARNSAAREISTNAQVAQTAMAILKLDPNRTFGNLDLVVAKLGNSIAATQGRTSDAKIAAAKAIAHMATFQGLNPTTGGDAVAVLAGILNGDNAIDTAAVRAEVANALGSLFRNHPSLYITGGDAYKGLTATMRLQGVEGSNTDDIVRARNNAGVALGRAPLSDEERFAVLKAGMAGAIPLTVPAAPAE